MSNTKPKFVADHDVNRNIVDGVVRREPSIEFARIGDTGLWRRNEGDLVAWAADRGYVIVSHDVNTIPGQAYERIGLGEPMSGLLMVRPTDNIAAVIESLLLIWANTEASEWRDAVAFLPL
jgi:hypothetical protein